MRDRRGQSILQVEGIEQLEARIPPAAPPHASLVGVLFSQIAPQGGLGQALGGVVGGGNEFGKTTAEVAKVHTEPPPGLGRGR